MAILTTIITSAPCDICSIAQASEETGAQVQYIYVLIRQDKLDVSYPFPSIYGDGQKFVVKNKKYEDFMDRWKEVHLERPDYNRKKKRKKKK